MEIIYFLEEKNTVMHKWQSFHFIDELRRYGHNIRIFNPLNYQSLDYANEALISHLNFKHYDLFMTPHNFSCLYLTTLNEIKKRGLPTLLICYDNLTVPYVHADMATHFDLVWLTSRENENLFKKRGAKTLFQPYAANPFIFKPEILKPISRILFIGSPYGSRVNMINNLLDSSIDISLYSPNEIKSNVARRNNYLTLVYELSDLMKFKTGRRILTGALKQKFSGNQKLKTSTFLERLASPNFEDFGKLYANYTLSLSSTAARNTGILSHPVHIVNLRSFEIPMCGGLQFCAHSSEISEYFTEDKEIILYRNEQDFIDKARFYLKKENLKSVDFMKIAARKRALGNHTWSHRFNLIFKELGIGQ